MITRLKVTYNYSIIKRWSEAESFTTFENHAYRSKKNLMFAQNFEAKKITQKPANIIFCYMCMHDLQL